MSTWISGIDAFDYGLEFPVACYSSSSLWHAKPNIRRTELAHCWTFSAQDPERYKYRTTEELLDLGNMSWIGRIIWYIARHAMQKGIDYIDRHIYRPPFSIKPFTAAVFSYSSSPTPHVPLSPLPPLPFLALSPASSSHHTPLHA